MSTATTDSMQPASSGLRLCGKVGLAVSGHSWTLSTMPPWNCTILKRPGHLLALPSDASGGLRGGDTVHIDLTLDNQATLVWQAPGATLFFPGSAGTKPETPASLETHIRVASGCSLVYLARPTIPCRGATIIQRTRIDLEPGAELYYQELWTAGRGAFGESFDFAGIDSRLDLNQNQVPLYREAWALGGANGLPHGPAGLAEMTSWGTALAVGLSGLSVFEPENQKLQELGFTCVTGTLGDNARLARLDMGGSMDRVFARFSPDSRGGKPKSSTNPAE